MRSLLLLAAAGYLHAAPTLRLSSSVTIPVSIPLGQVAAPPTLEAYNIGDGSLSLTLFVSARAPWLTASAGAPHPCLLVQSAASCIPLHFIADTASLKAGNYTGEVTVSDPRAVDSPQTVVVSINVGGQPPFQVDQYLNPGATLNLEALSTSCTHGQCEGSASSNTIDGGDWLSLAVDTFGTLGFSTRHYTIHLAPRINLPLGDYHGAVTVSRSGIDQTIPVSMHLANGPIAVPSTRQLDARLAEGGPSTGFSHLPLISLSNSGTGTLAVQDVRTFGAGITAIRLPTGIAVDIDPAGRTPGVYNDASLLISCNAANCPLRIPISLEIVPRQPPIIRFQGIVDPSGVHDFTPAALGQIMLLNGEQLSTNPPAYSFPLSVALGGVSVLVNGKPAPMLYTTSNQIAFQVPTDASPGSAMVQVQRDGQAGNTVALNIAAVAPRIRVVISNKSGWVDANHPTTAGASLTLWATGLGPTNPPVASGAPAPSQPLATVTSAFTVLLDNTTPLPFSAFLSPGSVGAYEVHLTLPANLAPGMHSVALSTKFSSTATATVPIE